MKDQKIIKETSSILIIIIILILTIIFISIKSPKKVVEKLDNNDIEESKLQPENEQNIQEATINLKLKQKGKNKEIYLFEYRNNTYEAIYTPDNWQIINSYQIRNQNDIMSICKALIEIHPIHGKDMKSYRKIEDLTEEWLEHNLIYDLLPDDNKWKNNVKDVDLDPKDQGRSLEELYESRTGKKLNIDDILKIYQ